MLMCEKSKKTGYQGKTCNGIHLEDVREEDLEYRGSKKQQLGWEWGNWAVWNG